MPESDLEIAHLLPVTLRHVMQEAARRGLDPALLCEGLGFSPTDLESDDFRVSPAQSAHVIRRVLGLMPRPGLGLELGASVNLVSWGAVGLGFMACGTSREMLDFAVEFQHAAGRLPRLHGEEIGQSFCLVAQAGCQDREVAAFLVDKTFAALAHICRQVVGPHFNPRQVDLVIGRPLHGAIYEDVFRCPVHFGRSENRMYFPSKPYAVRTADALVLRRVKCWLRPAGCSAAAASDLETAVMQAIRRNLGQPLPLGDVAASLHISERTLRRRLAGLGHSYAALLTAERRTRALSLITHSARGMHEVAQECGFADVRTLQRAVKRWTGHSPTSYRKCSRMAPPIAAN